LPGAVLLWESGAGYAVLTAIILLDFSLGEQRGQRSIGPILVLFIDLSPDSFTSNLFAGEESLGAALEEIQNTIFLFSHSTR